MKRLFTSVDAPVVPGISLEAYRERCRLEAQLEAGNVAMEGIFDSFRKPEDGDYSNTQGDYEETLQLLHKGGEEQGDDKPIKMGQRVCFLTVQYNKPVDNAQQMVQELQHLGKFVHDYRTGYFPCLEQAFERVLKQIAVPMANPKIDLKVNLADKFESDNQPLFPQSLESYITKRRLVNRRQHGIQGSENFLGTWFAANLYTWRPDLTRARTGFDYSMDEHLQDAAGHLAHIGDAMLKPYGRQEVKAVMAEVEKIMAEMKLISVEIKKLGSITDRLKEPGERFQKAHPDWHVKGWLKHGVDLILVCESEALDWKRARSQMLTQIDRVLDTVIKVCHLSLKRMG